MVSFIDSSGAVAEKTLTSRASSRRLRWNRTCIKLLHELPSASAASTGGASPADVTSARGTTHARETAPPRRLRRGEPPRRPTVSDPNQVNTDFLHQKCTSARGLENGWVEYVLELTQIGVCTATRLSSGNRIRNVVVRQALARGRAERILTLSVSQLMFRRKRTAGQPVVRRAVTRYNVEHADCNKRHAN
jgi:hypothetical protein